MSLLANTGISSKNVVHCNGGCESAVACGLVDLGVVVVESGETLRSNGLIVYKELATTSYGIWVNTQNHVG